MFDFLIPDERRAACAVYAVAIGQRLGFDLEALVRLRVGMETSSLTGDANLDEILRFVEGLSCENALGQFPVVPEIAKGDRIAQAYMAVAPVIQPLNGT